MSYANEHFLSLAAEAQGVEAGRQKWVLVRVLTRGGLLEELGGPLVRLVDTTFGHVGLQGDKDKTN